ncbi:MAG: hypothetical protein AB7P03_19420 [Kofleriaceae bacterium]
MSSIHRHSTTNAIASGLIALACAGCASDDPGDPPAISDLTYSPDTWTVGQQTLISGTLAFHDPDADVEKIGFELRLPGGATQPVSPGPTPGTSGRTDAGVSFAIGVVPPAAGAYSFEVWLIDEAGNESNRLSGTANAQ